MKKGPMDKIIKVIHLRDVPDKEIGRRFKDSLVLRVFLRDFFIVFIVLPNTDDLTINCAKVEGVKMAKASWKLLKLLEDFPENDMRYELWEKGVIKKI